ncbi:hypothetical protein AAU61_04255 [Desulfocarbo indianensis]|nr:hypothetical protein AAU61_04255 [Desulfocarbo indianensis]
MAVTALDKLMAQALELGAHAAAILSASQILVEERLAQICGQGTCPAYGKSPNCPPHVMTTARFKALLAGQQSALAFKFDVPTALLLSQARHQTARAVHGLAARLEGLALELGFAQAHGLAAGSCWEAFCDGQGVCPVLDHKGACLFPDQARPSLSGLGVNVFQLCADLGWPINRIGKDADPQETPMGLMAGLVLLG